MSIFIFLFLGTIALIAGYSYNTRHYRYGFKIGKKVVKQFRPEIDRKLTSSYSKKSIQERVEMIKEMVFQLGLSEYVKDYNQTVKHLQEQLASLKKESEVQKEKILKKFDEKDKQLTEEIKKLEVTLKTKEEELFQLKRDEDNRNEALEQSDRTKIQSPYFFSKLIRNTQEAFAKTTTHLETNLLRYLSALVIALLLAGDYFITLVIFEDILKIQFRNNQFFVYLASGVIALVFLVLIDIFLDFLNNSVIFKKYLQGIQFITVLIIGVILLLIYVLMVSISWLANTPQVLDSLLRLLFVPLILAAALTIRKMKKEYGFSFIFGPIKIVLYLLLIALFNLLLLGEIAIDYIRKFIQKEKYESKIKLTVSEEVENIKREILQKNGLHFSFKEQLELEINKLTEQYEKDVSKLEKKLNSLNSEMTKIRKGCENGIVSTLSLKAIVPS